MPGSAELNKLATSVFFYNCKTAVGNRKYITQ